MPALLRRLGAVPAPLRRLGAPPVRRAAALLVAVIAGGWLGLLVGGNVTTELGPVQATFSVRPWPWGDTTVEVAPLGSVTFDTHDGPLKVAASVQRIRPEAAERIVRNPESLNGLADRVVADLRAGLTRLTVQSAASAVAGSVLVALLLYRRRWRWVGASALASVVFLAGTGLAGYLTFNPRSIEEPRYTGLLSSAPRMIGNVENLAENFSHYRKELAKLVTNVSRLYSVTSGLSTYAPDPSTIRVLHVSDLHLNPAAWNLMHSVVEQFKVGVIVDSGDIVDHGTPVENAYVQEISTFEVPYVYVRGNHDSQITRRAVASQPNAVVLTGTVKEVAGLRFFGAGDPRFTPDKATRKAPDDQALRAVGRRLAQRLRTASPPADVAVIHDPTEAKALDGAVPLILSGHMHSRSTTVLPRGSRLMVQGSTGGAGFRALDGENPTPMQMSVLYIDRKTHRLQAWDAITVGGLGLSSAQITRHVVSSPSTPPSTPTGSPTTRSTVPTDRQTDRQTEPPASQPPVPAMRPATSPSPRGRRTGAR